MIEPNDYDIEIHHLGLHTNQERNQDLVFSVAAHVSQVDPTTNKIKLVFPTWTNDDQTYVESNWIPLGTPMAGQQYGMQILPFGGATVTDPDGINQNKVVGAEQVIVHIVGRKRALYVAGIQMFNQVDVPPSGYQDKSGVKANVGEWLFKHATGNYIYLANDYALTIMSLTNPAPVLIPKDAPSSLKQNITLGASAIGANSNSNGDQPGTIESNANITSSSDGGQQTSTSNLTISSTAKGATTNNANISESITSTDQGTAAKTEMITADSGQGTATDSITLKGNTTTMTITLEGNTNTWTLSVANGTVNVNSKDINMTGTETITLKAPKIILDDTPSI